MKEEALLDQFKDDFVLFIEAGFVAVKQLDEIAAKRLFKAAETLNPDNPAAQLGFGYIALNKLQIGEATKIFDSILRQDPDHHLAQAMLGICYLLIKSKRKKGEKLILDVKAKSSMPEIKNLADICMEWAEKDLKAKDFSLLTPKQADEEE